MGLTRRGRLVVTFVLVVGVSALAIALFVAAVLFGLAHPSACAWALPVLLIALCVLAFVWFVRSADRAPFQRAERSQLDDLDLPSTDRTHR